MQEVIWCRMQIHCTQVDSIWYIYFPNTPLVWGCYSTNNCKLTFYYWLFQNKAKCVLDRMIFFQISHYIKTYDVRSTHIEIKKYIIKSGWMIIFNEKNHICKHVDFLKQMKGQILVECISFKWKFEI